MKLWNYIQDVMVTILLYIALMTSILFLLVMFKVPMPLLIAICIALLFFGVSIFCYSFYRKKVFYTTLVERLEQLDKKCLISELVTRPDFLEGQIFYDALYEIDKSMYEEIEKYQQTTEDFKDYVELWIHEVKLPIASTTLMLHNNKPDTIKKIGEQIVRIENYVEQVLYFVRSENSEKDYLIKKCNLQEIVNTVIKRNKETFLLKKIALTIEEVNQTVLSDSKWLEFIINQIISNSIKYTRDTPHIYCRCHKIDTLIILEIEDNGIGISESDLPNVFTKSFTGQNGRIGQSSTGMGLYLANKLCEKLGHKIKITSQVNKGTKVSIYFKNNQYYEVLNEGDNVVR